MAGEPRILYGNQHYSLTDFVSRFSAGLSRGAIFRQAGSRTGGKRTAYVSQGP